MATENKKYIPALRFPEFQNDGEWKCVIIGDIIKTKFYGRDKSVTIKKLVTEVHLWTEYGETGESPVMKDLNEEDENGI